MFNYAIQNKGYTVDGHKTNFNFRGVRTIYTKHENKHHYCKTTILVKFLYTSNVQMGQEIIEDLQY